MGKVSVYVTPVAVVPPKLVKFTGTLTVLPGAAVAGGATVLRTSGIPVVTITVLSLALLFPCKPMVSLVAVIVAVTSTGLSLVAGAV